MGKRKRETAEPEEVGALLPDKKSKLLAQHIANGKVEMARNLEQARRYERQKLGAKQRDPIEGTNAEKVLAEIEALKTLDMKKLAERRLNKALIKTKSIAKTGLLPPEVMLPVAGTMDTATANITARLFKHREVMEAFEAAMGLVRNTLGVRDGSKNALKQVGQAEPKEEPVKKKAKKEPATDEKEVKKKVKDTVDSMDLDEDAPINKLEKEKRKKKHDAGTEARDVSDKLSRKALRDKKRAEKHKAELSLSGAPSEMISKKDKHRTIDPEVVDTTVEAESQLGKDKKTKMSKETRVAVRMEDPMCEEDKLRSFFESTAAKDMIANGSAAKKRKSKASVKPQDISDSYELNGHSDHWSESESAHDIEDVEGAPEDDLAEQNIDDTDYDSDDFAAFDHRLASSSDDNDDLDTPAKHAKFAALLKEQLAMSNNPKPNQKLDGIRDSIREVDNEDLTSIPIASANGISDSTMLIPEIPVARQPKTTAVARRMIFGHLGIRDPLRSKREFNSDSASENETSTSDPPPSSSHPVKDQKLHATDSNNKMKESPTQAVDAEPKSTSDSESYHTPLENMTPGLAESTKRTTPALSKIRKPTLTSKSPPDSKSDSSSDSTSEPSSGSDFDSDSSASESDVAPAFSTKSAKSAFLPSLTMGGYWSGSEEATDIEEDIAPRKNRRGQRARQQIWEKKFKEKAKHLKTEAKKKGRDEGWDAQRGATMKDDGRGKSHGARVKPNWRQKGPSGANEAPLGDRKAKPKHKDNEGALHPSWEAKKNMKEKAAGIVAFKGKKITFD